MKNRRKSHEPENADRWLLTYADLITLLLGLFVILYAMSTIDTTRYAEIVEALGDTFGTGVMKGNTGVIAPVETILNERRRIQKELTTALSSDATSLSISVTENERGVTVHIMDELLFASGSAELTSGALLILGNLSTVLRRLPNDIRIEGHTDNVPIRSSSFPSNWHLSVARAVNTGHYMISACGIRPEKVSIVGYSEYRPLLSNSTLENRARNRRVDIVIMTNVGKDSIHGSVEGTGS